MTRRIFWSIFGSCLAVLLLTTIGTVTVAYHLFFEEQITFLRYSARMEADLLNTDPHFPLDRLATPGTRISLIDRDGKVLYDSRENPETMDNHRARKEIIEASETGEGFALRPSTTLSEETYNAAVQLKNGSFLRLSRPHASFLAILFQSLGPMISFILAALLLSWWIARTAARSIVAPINAIDPNNPKKNPGYEQLDPLITRLEENRRQISIQMNELEQKNREFALLSEHMDEGLILLGPQSRLLFANRAALSIFPLEPDSSLAQMPALLQKLFQKAIEKGRSSKTVSLNAASYHLEAHRIENEETCLGVLALILDVSEREEIRKQRQEFTANVTHELKTPLQTILSASELLQNGMVSEKDQSVFAGYIHTEADRMTKMINDIIHLSRLDTLDSDEKEMVSFSSVVEQSVSALLPMARLRQIDLHLDLEPVSLPASPTLLNDIISCLLENAVLYNRDKGRIDVSLHPDQDQSHAVLKIRDTGHGIDPALHERVFERFYTADPSRNRQGTGLGLAIVRHAVRALHGTINLDSAPGKGSEFTVTLPLLPSSSLLQDEIEKPF